MKRIVLSVMVVCVVSLTPSVQGQIFLSRPGPRAGIDPRFSYLYGYRNPLIGGPFSGGVYGIPYANPYAVVPNVVTTNVTGQAVTTDPGYRQDANVNQTTPNVTGHPTRFADYSRYFGNQGGTTASPTVTTPVSRTPSSATIGSRPGSAPDQVRPSRTRQGTFSRNGG